MNWYRVSYLIPGEENRWIDLLVVSDNTKSAAEAVEKFARDNDNHDPIYIVHWDKAAATEK